MSSYHSLDEPVSIRLYDLGIFQSQHRNGHSPLLLLLVILGAPASHARITPQLLLVATAGYTFFLNLDLS